METSDWIAAAALTVAVLSWLDSWRRIHRNEAALTIDRVDGTIDLYGLRNSGQRALKNLTIDPASLLGYESQALIMPITLLPGASTDFYIRANSRGKLPDAITVRHGLHGRIIVPFRPSETASTASPPTTSPRQRSTESLSTSDDSS